MNMPISLPILARSAAGFLGLTGTVMGLYGIFNPAGASSSFGLPTTTTTATAIEPKSSKPSRSPIEVFVSVLGGRTLAVGLVNGIFAYQGNHQALAVCMLCGVVTSGVDAVLTFQYGERDKAWGHVVASGIILALGSYFWSLG